MAWAPDAPGAGPSGVSAGFTGGLLLLAMIVIYPAAHDHVTHINRAPVLYIPKARAVRVCLDVAHVAMLN